MVHICGSQSASYASKHCAKICFWEHFRWEKGTVVTLSLFVVYKHCLVLTVWSRCGICAGQKESLPLIICICNSTVATQSWLKNCKVPAPVSWQKKIHMHVTHLLLAGALHSQSNLTMLLSSSSCKHDPEVLLKRTNVGRNDKYTETTTVFSCSVPTDGHSPACQLPRSLSSTHHPSPWGSSGHGCILGSTLFSFLVSS